MINEKQFLASIIDPILFHLGMDSNSAKILMLGTAKAESGLTYLKQMNNGPALGVYQIEPKTHKDIWENYLAYRTELASKVTKFIIPGILKEEQLKGNLYYATAMARIHYRRVKEALPKESDPLGMSNYHKDHYNTNAGKADPYYNLRYFEEAAKLVLKGEE